MTDWLKMSATEMVKLNTLKPFARSEYGRISSVYDTMSGVNARLSHRRISTPSQREKDEKEEKERSGVEE